MWLQVMKRSANLIQSTTVGAEEYKVISKNVSISAFCLIVVLWFVVLSQTLYSFLQSMSLPCPSLWRENCFITFIRRSMHIHTGIEYLYAYEMYSYEDEFYIRSWNISTKLAISYAVENKFQTRMNSSETFTPY